VDEGGKLSHVPLWSLDTLINYESLRITAWGQKKKGGNSRTQGTKGREAHEKVNNADTGRFSERKKEKGPKFSIKLTNSQHLLEGKKLILASCGYACLRNHDASYTAIVFRQSLLACVYESIT
jgi:hypothetical protein